MASLGSIGMKTNFSDSLTLSFVGDQVGMDL